MTVPPVDDKPTDPPAPPSDPPAPPSDPPAPPSDPPAPHKAHDDGPILAAIGELKNMITGLATVASVDDESPAKKPWFARGGKS